MRYLIRAAAALLVLPVVAGALDLESFEARLTEHHLDNGLTFLIYERPEAPVVSFYTQVNAGSVNEVAGITGLAHMFEHMAFKGTPDIGTTDAAAEAEALAEVDRTYAALLEERYRIGGGDPDRLAELEAAWVAARERAGEYVIGNAYVEVIERAGGVGLNAGTGNDSTVYFYALPANKVELWAYLESERYFRPVLREFYTERDVVMEERRLRIEGSPFGRLIEQYLAAAYVAHPYGTWGIGHMSDLQAFSREDAQAFYETYYVPGNMVIAIVGAVDPETLLPMLERYFGRLPAGPPPPPVRTIEPVSIAERVVHMPDQSQPIYLEGYHRPAVTHPDDAVYDAIADVLSSGRTSRLYRRLVRDEKIAAQAAAFNGFPGERYPHEIILYAVPTPGHTNEEVQASIRAEIERLTTEPVSAAELEKVKTQAKAGLIRGLASNTGIAGQLADAQSLFGDWREVFRNVERIEAVTADDILRVAQETFKPTNRTVAMIVAEEE